MSSRVFLHVGSPKTGTTFIQNVLWSQRDLAATQGLHLPATSHQHFLASLDVRGLGGKAPHPPESVGAWNRLVNDVRELPDTALITHELFAAAGADRARTALGWLGTDTEVHVVITARDLIRQLTAEWQEHVKHNSTRTLPDFIAAQRANAADRKGWFWLVQDYAGIARRWGGRLPADRVHVVTVPPTGASSDLLWERFAGLVGLDAAAFDVTSARANTSLGQDQAEVMRRVNMALDNRLAFPGPYPGVAKDILAHQILASGAGTRLTMRADDVEFARLESERTAEAIEASGADVVGSLDDLVPSASAIEAATSDAAYDQRSDVVLLDESIRAISDLLVVLAERNQRLGEAETLIESLRRGPIKTALSQAAEERPTLDRARDLYRKLRG